MEEECTIEGRYNGLRITRCKHAIIRARAQPSRRKYQANESQDHRPLLAEPNLLRARPSAAIDAFGFGTGKNVLKNVQVWRASCIIHCNVVLYCNICKSWPAAATETTHATLAAAAAGRPASRRDYEHHACRL